MCYHILLELCLLYNQLPAQILISLWQTIISPKVTPVSALHILILPLVLQIITVNFFTISTFLFTELIHSTDVRAHLRNKITVSHCIVYDNSPQELWLYSSHGISTAGVTYRIRRCIMQSIIWWLEHILEGMIRQKAKGQVTLITNQKHNSFLYVHWKVLLLLWNGNYTLKSMKTDLCIDCVFLTELIVSRVRKLFHKQMIYIPWCNIRLNCQ